MHFNFRIKKFAFISLFVYMSSLYGCCWCKFFLREKKDIVTLSHSDNFYLSFTDVADLVDNDDDDNADDDDDATDDDHDPPSKDKEIKNESSSKESNETEKITRKRKAPDYQENSSPSKRVSVRMCLSSRRDSESFTHRT